MKLKKIIVLIVLFFSTLVVNGQSLTYSFTDPCTQEVTNFSFPLQQGQSTVIFFLGQQRTFTASDVASGAFGAWINQVYSDYRKVMPCSVQSTNVVRNQIISQVIGSTVQSVMGNIMSSVRSEAASNDAASKGKTESDKKRKNNKDGNSNNSNSNSVSNSGTNGNVQSDGGNSSGAVNSGGNDTKNNEGGNGGSVNNSSNNGSTSSTNSTGTKESDKKGEEVVGAVTMNVDARNDKGNSGSGGGKSSQRNNPVIVSSDYTNAQNLDRSYTGIINIGTSRSSLTGTSSWGVTSMVWLNFKQFAISGRYTMIHFSNNGKLKFIHNLNLTGLYTYGNYMGFVGYSGILNAGKWGVTGLNVSAAATKINEDGNLFLSPSITAFYTRPFMVGQRLTVSPEIYVISTPLVYSSLEKMTVTDRTFSGFIGSGFDYQITKRFKVNLNYKLNMSTSPDFPILSFFLIGSKVNL